MIIHFIFGLLTLGFLSFAALYVKARRAHESTKQAFENVLSTLRLDGSQLATDLVNKVHALENGGHLAAGTAQALVSNRIIATSGTNGGQLAASTQATS